MYRLRPMNPEQMHQVDVEVLSQWGWELVTVTQTSEDTVLVLVAVMRRVPPAS